MYFTNNRKECPAHLHAPTAKCTCVFSQQTSLKSIFKSTKQKKCAHHYRSNGSRHWCIQWHGLIKFYAGLVAPVSSLTLYCPNTLQLPQKTWAEGLPFKFACMSDDGWQCCAPAPLLLPTFLVNHLPSPSIHSHPPDMYLYKHPRTTDAPAPPPSLPHGLQVGSAGVVGIRSPHAALQQHVDALIRPRRAHTTPASAAAKQPAPTHPHMHACALIGQANHASQQLGVSGTAQQVALPFSFPAMHSTRSIHARSLPHS
jgi:hypothetical protein